MTDRSFEELRAELRQFEREQRDRKLRRGRAYPRTARESEIWLAGLAERYPNSVTTDDGIGETSDEA
jgi:hypothetical protein